MALALQMFSVLELDEAPDRTVTRLTDERWAWVALALVPEVGANLRRYHDLLRLGSPAEIFCTPARELAGVVGDVAARAISRFDWQRAAGQQAALAARGEARLVVLGDPEYPSALRSIELPPPFLLVRGTLIRADGLSVAVVGSRRATPYGLRVAQRLATDLAARGVTVISGLARGVDTAAHRGALDTAGRTVAVLGSGVDIVYPPENRRLAGEVIQAGALVSQFPMGIPPIPHHFPARNRLNAGMTLGTVVVEAAERSGALITARLAGELGREVYAVPGNVSSPGSQGANALIQDGAKLVQTWEDIVAEWPSQWRDALRQPAAAPSSAAGEAEPAIEPEERAILAALGDEPLAVDALVEESQLPSNRVSAGLMALELRGLVRRVLGQRFVRS